MDPKFDPPWYPMVRGEDEDLNLEAPTTRASAQLPASPFRVAVIAPRKAPPEDDEADDPDKTDKSLENPESLLFKNLDDDEFWSLAADALDVSKKSIRRPTSEFIPIPLTIAQKDLILLPFFQKCADRLLRHDWKPYRLKCLQQPAPVTHGTCKSGFVVRLGNPSNFHMIFENTSMIELMLKNEDWSRFFRSNKKSKDVFQTSIQLFHGMAALLVEYRKFLELQPQLGSPSNKVVKYQVGDLVAIQISRESSTWLGDEADGGHSSKLNGAVATGYRGVIQELVWAVDKMKMTENSFLVYLLDTGEVVAATERNLTPLPRAFTGFPPLAVKCSLHGISPIGPEWTSSATARMKELVTPKPEWKLFAEFYINETPGQFQETPLSDESQSFVSTSTLLDEIISAPYFNVELRFIPNPKPSTLPGHEIPHPSLTNISAKLIEEHFGLEWSLIPFRRHLRQPEKDHDGQEAPKDKNKTGLPLPSVSRDELLLLCEGPPYPVATLDMEQLDLEVLRLFANDPELEAQIITGELNEIGMKLRDDGDVSLKTECIPPVFRPL